RTKVVRREDSDMAGGWGVAIIGAAILCRPGRAPARGHVSTAFSVTGAARPDGPENLLLRIVSLNLNGIRSAFRKGLQPWLEASGAHVVCLQELKAMESDLTEEMRNPPGYIG